MVPRYLTKTGRGSQTGGTTALEGGTAQRVGVALPIGPVALPVLSRAPYHPESLSHFATGSQIQGESAIRTPRKWRKSVDLRQ
jgi:hypothetical protein